MGRDLRKLLFGCLLGLVGIPILLAVTVGIGGLLAAVDDPLAAAVCNRVAIVLGGLWVSVAMVALIAAAVAVLGIDAQRREPADETETNR